MEFLRVSSTADLRPRRVSRILGRIFRFQSVYVCERAPHARTGDSPTRAARGAGG